jgi:hypothetical protein
MRIPHDRTAEDLGLRSLPYTFASLDTRIGHGGIGGESAAQGGRGRTEMPRGKIPSQTKRELEEIEVAEMDAAEIPRKGPADWRMIKTIRDGHLTRDRSGTDDRAVPLGRRLRANKSARPLGDANASAMRTFRAAARCADVSAGQPAITPLPPDKPLAIGPTSVRGGRRHRSTTGIARLRNGSSLSSPIWQISSASRPNPPNPQRPFPRIQNVTKHGGKWFERIMPRPGREFTVF